QADGRLPWIVFLALATAVATTVFACAMPFAAIAAVATLYWGRAEALTLVGSAFLANQAMGFGLLGYPHEAQAYYWGIVMGIGAVAGYFAAAGAVSLAAPHGRVAAVLAALPAAFLAYEAVL